MSEQDHPRSKRSFGKKIGNSLAALAAIVPVLAFMWATLAPQTDPTIDISLPETIQIQCGDHDFDNSSCRDGAQFETVVDLFSILNSSLVSTKTEVLEKITGVAEFNNGVGGVVYSLPLSWKYFTEITDVGADKRNTARVTLPKGKIENLETEFVADHEQLPENEHKNFLWTTFIGGVKEGTIDAIAFTFILQFAHSEDREMSCVVNVDQRMKNAFSGERRNTYHYAVRTPTCRLI